MYDTDEEQIEAMKKWWLENGNMVIGAIFFAVVAYFGMSFYNNSVESQKEEASSAYQDLLEMTTDSAEMTDDLLTEINQQITVIKKDHEKSTYAIYAALYSAKLAIEAKNLDQAAAELNWALDQSVDSNITQLIQLRLARVEFARGNSVVALKLLSNESGKQLVGFEEVRGDILLAQGDVQEAKAAYQKAWDAAAEENLQRPILEMKLNDLATD